MAPFIAVQAALTPLGGFAAVFVMADQGTIAVVQYAALMLGVAGAATVSSFALGRLWPMQAGTLVRAGFLAPVLLLPLAFHSSGTSPEGAFGVPVAVALALAFGTFLGLTWGARHWFELQVLGDEERDGYATHAVALAVGIGLATTLTVSALLTLAGERREPVYGLFMLLGLLGAAWAPRHLPAAPPVRLVAPMQVLRQPGYRACLPLFFLESGLLGIGQVLNATGAVRALGEASHYGWAASAATLAGAAALYAARGHRHSANRVGWMRSACAGVVLAAALLGASAWWPALFVLHLLLNASVQPFWSASEHVLNQRAMDLHGAVGDRVVAREGTLAVLRLLTLGAFWLLAAGLDDRQRLICGAALVAAAATLEYRLGRAWLKAGEPGTAGTARAG